MKKRVFIVVLDSFGIGEEPDAPEYGDEGSNTLCACATSPHFSMPNLQKLGLFNIDGALDSVYDVDLRPVDTPTGAFGRLREASKGKDTTVGHWELAGVISPERFPTYPDYGREMVETGSLIVYTSADSVFQIAAHEDVVSCERLYEYCRIARKILTGKHAVARVIARPFIGEEGSYTRTPRRHDFSLEPTGETMLDALTKAGVDVISVGKIYDIFAHRGIKESIPTTGNPEGIDRTIELLDRDFEGLCFVNLVDTDMIYGHRNDVDGYAKALAYFDEHMPTILGKLREGDLFMVSADHGCDPVTPSTDHSREYVPWVIAGPQVRPGANLGTSTTFADVSTTVLDYLGVPALENGTSRLSDILEVADNA